MLAITDFSRAEEQETFLLYCCYLMSGLFQNPKGALELLLNTQDFSLSQTTYTSMIKIQEFA